MPQAFGNLSLEKKEAPILHERLDVTGCAKSERGLKFNSRTIPPICVSVNDAECNVRLCERGIEAERIAGGRSCFGRDLCRRNRLEERRKRERETQS